MPLDGMAVRLICPGEYPGFAMAFCFSLAALLLSDRGFFRWNRRFSMRQNSADLRGRVRRWLPTCSCSALPERTD